MQTISKPATFGLKKALIGKTAKRRSSLSEATPIAAVLAQSARRNDLSPKLRIERRTVASLKVAQRRVRKPSAAHTERLVRVLKTTGVCAPILIDRDGRIVDGHTVVEAAKLLGIETIPCVVIQHLTPSEIEFLKVALNRLQEHGEWDIGELRPLLSDLRAEGFLLEDTAFSVPELDAIILDDVSAEVAPPCEPIGRDSEPVTRTSDLWLLGEHRIYCGDATQKTSFDSVLKGEIVQAVFTDPPWNIPIKGFVSSSHDDFVMGAGEMSEEEFRDFVDRFTALCIGALDDGGLMFTCIDWRSFDLIVRRARTAGLLLINTAVWNKGSGGMGGLYRSAHELIPVFCKGKKPRVNNVELGKHGRDRTNVWSYPGANRRGSSAGDALADHPTPKPIELVHDAIINVSDPGEIILDPFIGSGTTLLAAERAGRIARGIELDPRYVDVSLRRWQLETGRPAVLESSGMAFDEVRARRADGDIPTHAPEIVA